MSVLFFLEDPGAVGFISQVLVELKKTNVNYHIMAKNHASRILKEKELDFIEPKSEKSIEDFFDKNKIKLVITGTSQNVNSKGLFLIDFAKKKNIKTIGFVDSMADSELRFMGKSHTPLNHKPDFLIVPDILTQNIFINLGFEKEKIIISGNPNYEAVINKRAELEKIDYQKNKKDFFIKAKDKKIVVFIDEHSNKNDPRLFKSKDYNFEGRKNSKNRNEVISGEILNIFLDLGIEPFFVVKLHPKSDRLDYKNLLHEIDEFHSHGKTHNLIYAADLIIGMTSILLMESFLLGKDVISVIPQNSEKNWMPPSMLSHVDCAYNCHELKFLIKKVLIDNKTLRKEKFKIDQSPKDKISKYIRKHL